MSFPTPEEHLLICHPLLDELVLLMGSHMVDVITVRAVPTEVTWLVTLVAGL
jgi:hypothetical protein